ncbi:hypothetical protein [Butyrivibrio proteoclasticus]|uniref:hypothetical protein n=1 Tax=Butyrivibrio proteoclasticus TaxID=43305 RepID=UPI0005541012|nr:hypothetical protein [Butyrivibrio proteoclasticus]
MEEEQLLKKKADPIYSDTAYDDAFKTMEGKCDDLVIPFVNHMFNEKYGKKAVIKRLRNEQFIECENAVDEKRITDSSFEITDNDITKKYHIECESKKYDGSILVRLFEYDSSIALRSGEGKERMLKVKFPNTGLLVLRTSGNEPDNATIEIEMPEGDSVSYTIPIIKMSDLTIDEIFNKQLYMLIPFYIFNYESQLVEIDKNKESIEEFIDVFRNIFDRLDKELESGNLSALSRSAIIKLTYIVSYKLTMKTDNIQKEVGDFMGGKVLDLPEFMIFDQGKEVGLAEGEAKRQALAEERDSIAEERDSIAEERDTLAEENARLKRALEEATKGKVE